MNDVAIVSRFQTSRVQCCTGNYCDIVSEGPAIIMHQLKSFYNSTFKGSRSHPIHTRFARIASNEYSIKFALF